MVVFSDSHQLCVCACACACVFRGPLLRFRIHVTTTLNQQAMHLDTPKLIGHAHLIMDTDTGCIFEVMK